MGILADGGAILAGGLLGSLLGSRIKQNNMQFLALVIMIISLPEAAACLLAFENQNNNALHIAGGGLLVFRCLPG